MEITIFNRGYDYWKSLIIRGTEQNVLTPHDVTMLDIASQYCLFEKVTSISPKQAKAIEEIRLKLEENGIV